MLKKLYNAAVGLYLYNRYARTFTLNKLKDKKVVLIGPADSALNTGLGTIIDSYDCIIRINKAPYQLIKGLHKTDIGSKTDILFHSFLENERTGGGKLDFELYDKLGIRHVVNPLPTNLGKRNVYNFYKKHLLCRKVYHVEKAPYFWNIKKFGKYRPTTGFSAINFTMHADFESLHLTGFTFFKTEYGLGYRDHFRNKEINDLHIKSEQAHNPQLEFELFAELLKTNQLKTITTDDKLSKILKQEKSIYLPVLQKK